MRFALEVFEHALESYVSERPRDRKLAVLNLAQVLELAVKAALVEKNIPIYDKSHRTINTHEAVTALARSWGLERIPMQARLELLIDERNAIQHRYGSVDEVTMDYHMQTAFAALSEILEREFDANLQEWVRSNVDEGVWRRVRFVEQEQAEVSLPSTAIVEARSPTLDLIDGFAKYERALREVSTALLGDEPALRSSLDVVMKFLANTDQPSQQLMSVVPDAYRVRNQVIHGHREATTEEVSSLLRALDSIVNEVRDPKNAAVLEASLRASAAGYRGTRAVQNVMASTHVEQHFMSAGETSPAESSDSPAQQGVAPDGASRRR